MITCFVKLLSLNLWGGRAYGSLMEFLEKYNGDVDIFCFQEIFDTADNVVETGGARANLYQELSNLFIDYHGFYYPTCRGVDPTGHIGFDLKYGLGIFVKKSIIIDNQGDFFTFRSRFAPMKPDFTDNPSNVSYVSFNKDGKNFLICNIHGIWHPGDKLDNSDRIAQSEKTLEFTRKHAGPKILCGDFNLRPYTQCIKMIEQDFINLIKKNEIKTTRSSLDPYQGTPEFQPFADYTFVSKDINVVSFEVPVVEVSHHLPIVF